MSDTQTEVSSTGQSDTRVLDAKLVLSIIAAGIMSFAGVVVETSMNVTFPTLMSEFGVATSTVQWITTGYLLVLAAVIPTSSYLKRRFKLKTLFVTAALLFILGTALCATASVFTMLLIGRLIQGVGTGVALPLMFNIVLDQVPYNRLGLMMGVASLITAVAPAIGPSVGGLIVTYLGWRMIFVFLLILLVIGLIIGIISIRQTTPIEKARFSWLEWILLVIGFACFIFALSSASTAGWGSIQVIGLFIVAVIAIVLFGLRSRRSDHPLIHIRMFRYAPFTLSVLTLVLIQMICLGNSYLIPNYSQIVLDLNAFLAGCMLLPGCVIGAILAPISGRIFDRLGAKLPILFGCSCAIISCILFNIFTAVLVPVMFIFFNMIFSLAQGTVVGTSMTNGLSHLPEEYKADGNAVNNTMQQLAGAVGTALVTTCVASAQVASPDLAAGTVAGAESAYVILLGAAILAMLCSIGVFVFSRRSRTKIEK